MGGISFFCEILPIIPHNGEKTRWRECKAIALQACCSKIKWKSTGISKTTNVYFKMGQPAISPLILWGIQLAKNIKKERVQPPLFSALPPLAFAFPKGWENLFPTPPDSFSRGLFLGGRQASRRGGALSFLWNFTTLSVSLFFFKDSLCASVTCPPYSN